MIFLQSYQFRKEFMVFSGGEIALITTFIGAARGTRTLVST